MDCDRMKVDIDGLKQKVHDLTLALNQIECEHEPELLPKVISAYKEDVSYYACKKCGEFYR